MRDSMFKSLTVMDQRTLDIILYILSFPNQVSKLIIFPQSYEYIMDACEPFQQLFDIYQQHYHVNVYSLVYQLWHLS